MTKKFSLFLVLMLSIFTFGSLKTEVEAQTGEEEVTFILHKVLFDFDKMPEQIVNNGAVNPNLTDYEMLNGAEFEVYEMTDELKAHLAKGLSVTDAQMELAKLDLSGRTPLKSGVTAGEGTVAFSLPSGSENIAYLFHESNLPADVRERAANLVAVLPYADAKGERLSEVHLYPKNESEKVPVDKKVTGDVSYEIGEPIAYSITTRTPANPQDYEFFRIRDAASSVLSFDADSLEVRIGGNVVEDIYTLTPNANGFVLDFDLTQLRSLANQEIVVSYNMSLSPEAVPDMNYFNEVSVEYDNQINIDQDLVRTGGYRFVKVDLRDENRKLAGARFVLRNEEGNYLMVNSGNYSWTSNRKEATRLTSNADGAFEIKGLRYGSYYLEEVEAPEGYVMSDTAIPFNVSNGTFSPRAVMNIVNQPVQPSLPVPGGEPEVPTPDRPRLPITGGVEQPDRPRLPFTRGVEKPVTVARPRLPRTGERNTIIFSILGIGFILSALFILTSKKEKRGKKNEEIN